MLKLFISNLISEVKYNKSILVLPAVNPSNGNPTVTAPTAVAAPIPYTAKFEVNVDVDAGSRGFVFGGLGS